jgi:hypothetical protein
MTEWTWKTEAGATVNGPRPDGETDDAAFFRDGPATNLIATVTLGRKSVSVYCTGEMRVQNLGTDERYSNAADLVAAGYTTDRELTAAEDRRDVEFIHNPWFELETETDGAEGLDLIEHSYAGAILLAEGVLTNPDYDVLFDVEEEVA